MDYKEMVALDPRQPQRRKLPIRHRKNLDKIFKIISDAFEKGVLVPDTIISTRRLRAMIGDEELGRWFNRAILLGDDHGPTRSLGDLLGGHGLGFRGEKGYYLIPKKLPIVIGNALYEEAEY